jgi:shikimate 5-dehydrogenase
VKYLQHLSDEVQMSGVCNTVYKQNGVWCGKNTDLLAMVDLLRPYCSELQKGVLIIGTGATARTSIVAVKQLGGKQVFITGRNHDKGEELSNKYDVSYVIPKRLRSIRVGCIIQTTPVGMFPQENECPPATELFKKNMIVFDVIYNPVFTKFLQLAKEQGCVIISGREMFLLQAAYQFEIFSGVKTSLIEIREIWEKIHQRPEKFCNY